MGKYTIFYLFENPRRSMQARNFTTNVPKILDLKSSSEQIFFRKLSLGAPAQWLLLLFISNSLANLLAGFVQIFMDSGKVLHFRFSILSLFLPILVLKSLLGVVL